MSHDEQTSGERLDQHERHVLLALIQDPFPWTVEELARDMGMEGRWTEDAVAALDAAGLVHRFVVLRPVGEDQREGRVEVVIPTRAARRLDELQGGAL
jgi:DNA-binding MarR family transcriptional regulator